MFQVKAADTTASNRAGAIRVTSLSFKEGVVILPNQVLEVRNLDGRVRISRKERHPDAGDPPRTPSDYDSYQSDDDLLVETDAVKYRKSR